MIILGVRFGHDSAAALIVDGKIVADVAEERFSRTKNDTSFPLKSIQYCLQAGEISSEDINVLAIPSGALQPEFDVFFDIHENNRPPIKKGLKAVLNKTLRRTANVPVLPRYQKKIKLSHECKVLCIDHHLSHIASAAYTSGIDTSEKVLGITMDGRGDGHTSVGVWRIQNNRINELVRFGGEGSMGWFYANATEAMGWRHGSEEWKVMGLAPYGTPQPGLLKGYYPEFEAGKLVRPHDFGDFGRWHDHGGTHYHGKDSDPMSKIFESVTQEDFAAEVQRISEEQAFNIVLPWLKKEQTRHMVCAGGFFLNVKFNQNLWYTGNLDTQWVYPNPGDAGLAVGAALYVHFHMNPNEQHEPLDHVYFGPKYSNNEVKTILDDRAIDYSYHENIEEVTARYLACNLAVGWFQGRMEAGPRALGNRSILMSPLDAHNKDLINAKVKYREKFRPFCPSIAAEAYDSYLHEARDELFMVSSFEAKKGMKERIPAVVHEDNSARPQKVHRHINTRYHTLITEFGKLTGEAIVLNTSFNIKGEPIVCNPREAIKCFYDTGLDVLVLGNYLIRKSNIAEIKSKSNSRKLI